MVMSSAHESSATPVYEHRGKTNPACQSLSGYTHALKHAVSCMSPLTHTLTHTFRKHTLCREKKSSEVRSLVGSVGGQRLRTERQKDADRDRLI